MPESDPCKYITSSLLRYKLHVKWAVTLRKFYQHSLKPVQSYGSVFYMFHQYLYEMFFQIKLWPKYFRNDVKTIRLINQSINQSINQIKLRISYCVFILFRGKMYRQYKRLNFIDLSSMKWTHSVIRDIWTIISSPIPSWFYWLECPTRSRY